MNSEVAGTLSSGCRFSKPVREWAEDLFSFHFNQVHLQFSAAPRALGGVAFASGSQIAMVPELASAGAEAVVPLLAHELAHVVQQSEFRGSLPAGVLRHRDLEAEAIEWERGAAGSNPFEESGGVDRLFEPGGSAGIGGYGVVQLASSGYGLLKAPDAKLPGGLMYFQQERLAKSFRDAVEHYVRLVKPGDVGVQTWDDPGQARKNYVRALYERIERKPYLLKELVGDKKVAFDDLSPADRRWVKDTLYRAYDAIRQGPHHMEFTTRIRFGHHAEWVDFRTKDCVFAAILRTMKKLVDARVDPRGKQDAAKAIEEGEKSEAAMEAWLAEQFGVSQQITPDVQLIHILESDLGWKNMGAVETFKDLKAHKSSAFIVSYEKTPGTAMKDAFWHTVYVEITAGGKPDVTDRQATGMGSSGAIADSAKCDAWLVDTTSSGYTELKKKFNIKFG